MAGSSYRGPAGPFPRCLTLRQWGRRTPPTPCRRGGSGCGAVWVRPVAQSHGQRAARLPAAGACAVCPLPEAPVPTAVTTGLAHVPPEASSTPCVPQGHGLASARQTRGPSVPGRGCLGGRRGPAWLGCHGGRGAGLGVPCAAGAGCHFLVANPEDSFNSSLAGWAGPLSPPSQAAHSLCLGHVTPPDSLVTGSLGSGPRGLTPVR